MLTVKMVARLRRSLASLLHRRGNNNRSAGAGHAILRMVPRSLVGEEWVSALRALPPNDSSPYDVVLGWDLLIWLDPDERAAATARLAEITAPRARIHLIVDGTGAATAQPLEYTLVGAGRLAEQAVGPLERVSHPSRRRLLRR